MKHCLILLFVTYVLAYTPPTGYAGPKEDYEEAYKIYIAAGASAAAYTGRLGELVNRYMEQDGWQIDHYVQIQGQTGARYLIARKEGTPYYIVAIVGTENEADIKIDLKVDKVYFTGSTPEEFAANATKKNIPDSEPKVHRGFNEFVQAGPSAVLRNSQQTNLFLPDLFRTDKKLYLTGHSLGGAAATLSGARLLSTGVSPEKIEVITFGAPAVGNEAFAAKFGPVLQLTRVVNSGDPVTGALQTLVGGYRQFGREIKWSPPDTIHDAHQLTGYIDSAIKNYYIKRRQAVEAGMFLSSPPAAKQTNPGRVYIIPLQNNLSPDLTEDFWYMQEALQDEYRQSLPDYILATTSLGSSWREPAMASGCRWAIVADVSSTRLKQEKNMYYITLTQTVYDVTTGSVAASATFSTATYTLTPLEAFIHTFKGVHAHLNDQYTKTK